MQRKDFTIQSTFDNLNLKVVVMVPDTPVLGVVQFVHGMTEHKERYFDFMDFFLKEGYAVSIYDHRGHGESVLNKDDLGYFYDSNANAIVEDLFLVTNKIKDMFSDVPIILFSHSMGSLVARNFLKKYDNLIDKLIVCGSPSKNPFTGIALFIVNIMSLIKGGKYRSNLIQNLAFNSCNKKVGATKKNGWLCANSEMVDKYNEDALCSFIFTLNGFRNLFKLLKNTYNKNGWNVKNSELPILFLAGEDDPIIEGEKGWVNAQNFLRDVDYNSVSGILYDGMRHEIFHEKRRDLVFSDIINWIQDKTVVICESE